MKIHNVRYKSFATNSSSTHCIIFVPDAELKNVEDKEVNNEYGWNQFVLGSKHAKKTYLAQLLYENLRREVGSDIAGVIALEWTGCRETLCADTFVHGYIDHQSELKLPTGFDGKAIDKEFFMEFQKYVLQDNFVVVGGNDNVDDEGEPNLPGRNHPITKLPGAEIKEDLYSHELCEKPNSNIVARQDGDNWTLFDRGKGNKIRMNFNHDAVDYTKSSVPELVDIKITDYCDFGCVFCYQGSTTQGAHAEKRDLVDLAYKLQAAKVFEVALGGGEPTSHPDFIEILEVFRSLDVIPNFTTRSFEWVENKRDFATIMELVGGVAFSTESSVILDKFLTKVLSEDYPHAFRQKISVQIVMGTVTRDQFEKLLKMIASHSVGVTLLDYKTTGRGSEFKPISYNWWLDAVKENRTYCSIGIDTPLAKRFEKELKEAGVNSIFYHMEEGKFSCYIDAVTSQMAPSSFCEVKDYTLLNRQDRTSWLDLYKTY